MRDGVEKPIISTHESSCLTASEVPLGVQATFSSLGFMCGCPKRAMHNYRFLLNSTNVRDVDALRELHK